MIKKIRVFTLIIALIVNLCVVPTHISYADTATNSIKKIAIEKTAMAIAIGSALGITVGQAGYALYSEKFLTPIKQYLTKHEEKNGVMSAYVKDGKTYVSKEVIQDVADYMTEKKMFTNVINDIDGIYLDTFLDVDGIMDNESFLMSCPYFSDYANKYPTKASAMYSMIGLPYYYTHCRETYEKYTFGIMKFSDKVKYIQLHLNEKARIIEVRTYDEYKTMIGTASCNFGRVQFDANSSMSYVQTIDSGAYYTPDTVEWDFGFRIGLKEQVVCLQAYSVADKGLNGKSIDNWDTAWAQQAIDVLKDIEINTSISADAVESADAESVIDALPLSLPQYGIDGTTADDAMQNTASIPMSQAKSGEVTLSPSAIDALSEAIAQAISEAGTTTGEQTLTGEISITPPTYGDLGQYKLDLKDVFPFCIPFDLIRLVKCFLAEPQAPYIEFPIMYPTGIYTTDTCNVVIDLSEYNSVAQVVRTLETILFMLGLIKITRAHMIKA